MNALPPTDQLTERIIGAAISVHRELGPGLLESAYEGALAVEFRVQGIQFVRQLAQPVFYKNECIDVGFRLDFLVEQEVILELKAVRAIEPVHEAQIMSYLKLGGFKRGLLINFNVPLLKDGIKRFSM
jgi:GxxExxY protein